MRYFRNGNRVIRVDVDADSELGPDLLKASAEVYSLKSHKWVERPELTSAIIYTGDWDACTEDEAFRAIKTRKTRIKQVDAVAYP